MLIEIFGVPAAIISLDISVRGYLPMFPGAPPSFGGIPQRKKDFLPMIKTCPPLIRGAPPRLAGIPH